MPRPARLTPALLGLLALGALTAPARADFDGCLAAIGAQAEAAGVSASTVQSQLGGIRPDPDVITASTKQPEFKTPIWDYMASLVDEERVSQGRALLRQYGSVLAGIQRRTGVDPAIVVAVWGVESNYGQNPGKFALVPSLATLACRGGGRASYWRSELVSTLRIIQRGDMKADHLVGSWAGAFGQTQFMPSTYLRLAVDGDGDGRRDVVDSPTDALASTANFLARSGWQKGGAWGFEVKLPEGFRAGLAGRTRRRPMATWAKAGLERADGRPLPAAGRAGLMLPAGVDGPAFLVYPSFDAIYAYNAAESYGLAIGHLADRLRGGPEFITAWPTDDPGLSREQKRELQTILTGLGYDVGPADGAVGDKTHSAIKDVERRLGWPETGRPGFKLLARLRTS